MDLPEHLLSSLEDAYRMIGTMPESARGEVPASEQIVAEVGRLVVPYKVMREVGLAPHVVLARSQPINKPGVSCRYDLVAASTSQTESTWYPALVDSTYQPVAKLDDRIYALQDKLHDRLGADAFPFQNSIHLLASTDELHMTHIRQALSFKTPYLGRDILKRHQSALLGMRSSIAVAQAVLTRMPAVRPTINKSLTLPTDVDRMKARLDAQAQPERLVTSMGSKDVGRMLAAVAFSTMHLDARDAATNYLPRS